jgi:hypothetical protein
MAEPVYQTSNGPRTATQMMNELVNVGWNGSGEIKDVYARTTGGAVTAGSNTTGATTPGVTTPAVPGPQLANTTAANQLLSQAQQAAYQAYLNARLALDTDQEAFTKAQAAFTNKISEAGITGSYNGQPTLGARQQAADIAAQVAGLTGVYTPPSFGGATGGGGVGGGQSATEQSVQWLLSQNAALGDPNYQQQLLQSRGWIWWPGEQLGSDNRPTSGVYPGFQPTTPATGGAVAGSSGGVPTLAAINQQAQLSGTYNGAPTEAAREFNAKTATDYLSLISNLRGPQDYGQYLRVIGSTPGGLKDLVGSAAGQYIPATGATTNAPTAGASLGGLVGDVTGQGQFATLPVVNSGGAVPYAQGGTPTSYADYQNAASNLPKPNQISADAWNSYTDSQKKMLLGMYENQGYNVNDVQDLYKQSLPKYSYSGSGTVKLA